MNKLAFAETGLLSYDAELDEHRSAPMTVPLLDRDDAELVIVGYRDDPSQHDFETVVRSLLACDRDALLAASQPLYQYYADMKRVIGEDDVPSILTAEEAWDHVQLGREVYIERRHGGDKRVYASIECECEWETEHGLQLVLRDGLSVCKLGPYDGHLTNADAYSDPALESVVYRGMRFPTGG